MSQRGPFFPCYPLAPFNRHTPEPRSESTTYQAACVPCAVHHKGCLDGAAAFEFERADPSAVRHAVGSVRDERHTYSRMTTRLPNVHNGCALHGAAMWTYITVSAGNDNLQQHACGAAAVGATLPDPWYAHHPPAPPMPTLPNEGHQGSIPVAHQLCAPFCTHWSSSLRLSLGRSTRPYGRFKNLRPQCAHFNSLIHAICCI